MRGEGDRGEEVMRETEGVEGATDERRCEEEVEVGRRHVERVRVRDCKHNGGESKGCWK